MLKPTETKQGQIQVKGVWGDARSIDPIFVDELQVQDAGDRCYITFGQVRLPAVNPNEPLQDAEIRPVVRLVVTQKTLAKMLAVLTRATPGG